MGHPQWIPPWYCDRMPPVQQVQLGNFLTPKYSTVNYQCCYDKVEANGMPHGMPHKMTKWGQRMLRCIMCRGHQLSAEPIALGFHGRAAASKPYINKCNAKRWMQWCKAHRHWTLEQWRPVLWSNDSCFSIWQSDGRVWVWWLPTVLVWLHCVKRKVWWRGIMVRGCSSGAGLGPLVPVKGTHEKNSSGDWEPGLPVQHQCVTSGRMVKNSHEHS